MPQGTCLAPCHGHADEAWTGRREAPSDEVTNFLGVLDGADARSRLSRQIATNPELDGLLARVPDTNT